MPRTIEISVEKIILHKPGFIHINELLREKEMLPYTCKINCFKSKKKSGKFGVESQKRRGNRFVRIKYISTSLKKLSNQAENNIYSVKIFGLPERIYAKNS